MGIYASFRDSPKTTDPETKVTTFQRFMSYPGEVYVQTITETAYVLHERTNCFCCSCPEFSSDPFCRNHGYAGTRPCLVHEMPGQEDDEGVMPDSVQARRAAQEGSTS